MIVHFFVVTPQFLSSEFTMQTELTSVNNKGGQYNITNRGILGVITLNLRGGQYNSPFIYINFL